MSQEMPRVLYEIYSERGNKNVIIRPLLPQSNIDNLFVLRQGLSFNPEALNC